MGCGKSSVGRELSKLLCCPFMDLDAEIEERCGCTVTEIFAERGEAEFRRLEKETLKDILETGGRVLEIPKMILALGGGAVMTPACERMVHEETVCVYLKASVDTLVERLTGEDSHRPLLKTSDLRTRILALMSQRAATYERVAHLTVDTDGKGIREIAEEITLHPYQSQSSAAEIRDIVSY